jgi:ribonuclease P protein subunit RPR2
MTLQGYGQKPSQERRIASERIEKLFIEAEAAFKQDPKLSDRYIALARKIAMKFKVRLKSEFKRKFCKHCYSYLKPGINCRIRLSKKQITYHCDGCKRFMRFGYRK